MFCSFGDEHKALQFGHDELTVPPRIVGFSISASKTNLGTT